MDRRRFLKHAAQLGGAAGAMSMLPPSLVQAWAEPAPRGGWDSIEHVVILMQENRSFDHYFGGMPGVRGYADLNALQLSTGRSVFHQPDGGRTVLPYLTTLQNIDGTDHGTRTGHDAFADGRHDRWIPAKGDGTMVGYDRDCLGFYYQLAEAFTLCDGYHCSVNGPTDPNRMYLFTGTVQNPLALDNYAESLQTSLFADDLKLRWMRGLPVSEIVDAVLGMVHGMTGALPQSVAQALAGLVTPRTGNLFLYDALLSADAGRYVNDVIFGLPWTTYAERLEQRGIGWRVYQEWDNYTDNALDFFLPFREAARSALKYTNGGGGLAFENFFRYYSDLERNPSLEPTYAALLKRGMDELAPGQRALVEKGLLRARAGTLVESFRTDVAMGRLPAVSWIVAPYVDCEHPVMGPRNGQALVHGVLEALAEHPDVWNKTVFILNYDENDGYFDHIPAPTPPPGTPGEYFGRHNVGLGARTPAIIVSPWSKQAVCSELFDHTSVLKFLERVTGVAEPNISPWRRQMCGDLSSLFDFGAKRTLFLPSAAPRADQPMSGVAQPLPFVQRMPKQESGRRARVPLPYRLQARWVPNGSGGITLTIDNGGTGAVHCAVHPNAFVKDYTPIRFDIPGGGTVAQDLPGVNGRYDYTLYGPDGFQRRFAGDLQGPCGALRVDVKAATSGKRTLAWTFENAGKQPISVSVVSNAYRADGPWTIDIGAGKTERRDLSCDSDAEGGGWYDFTVTADADAGFLCRTRGFVETGAPGLTADDAAPFDRLLLDRSMYEPGRDLVVSYALAAAVAGHRLEVQAEDPGGHIRTVATTPAPVRTQVLGDGVMRDEVVFPADGLTSGTYVLRHLDDTGRVLARPVRFRVL
ncbi:alkaline phosphatase family protein [Nocardia sp. CDC153]|uniref:alkaline phosphatase family protein n=1 Tax=Nocardia sp. CDC153 TaxID=3112167 RepID=UPI002DB909DD|nr:alkaline phosphatase family protein [Nocardia sp. CDC153]MEC3951944.1 alkaline phosphatase family protein [Nocardia sp. CDC153]